MHAEQLGKGEKNRRRTVDSIVRAMSERMSHRTLLLLVFAILAADLLLVSLVAPFFIDGSSSCGFLKRLASSNRNSSSGTEISSSSSSSSAGGEKCDGRRIFVYDLPPKFNADLVRACHLLNPWASMCPALANSGFGPPIRPKAAPESDSSSNFSSAWPWRSGRKMNNEDNETAAEALWRLSADSWYATDQYMGELIFHSRLLQHGCRTFNPEFAAAFYIPFYASLDVSRYLWPGESQAHESGDAVDRLGLELLDWLQNQEAFRRSGGLDHFLMSGRISWDFRRLPEKTEDWGSSLFHRPRMKNVTRLIVERSPWEDREIGIPYPTTFHPSSDAAMDRWRAAMASRHRKWLLAFAGSPRPGIRHDFRAILLDQCSAALTQCKSVDCGAAAASAPGGCSNGPFRIMELFMESTFCLQPRGDSFTRRSIFDSLIAGCIPVLFWNQTAYWQYEYFLPTTHPESYSVFIPHQEIRSGAARIATILAAVPRRRIAAMRATILEHVPSLVYAAPGGERTFRDVVDVAVDAAVDRITAAAPPT